MRFYVPPSADQLKAAYDASSSAPYLAPQVLSYQADLKSFISEIFPIPGCEEPSVRRMPLPSNFRLDDNTTPGGVSVNTDNVPLYYVYAGDARLELDADEALPLDRAMMAYIRSLPPDHPLIPYVLY